MTATFTRTPASIDTATARPGLRGGAVDGTHREAAMRLRERIRTLLRAELPARVERAAHAHGSPLTAQERRAVAQDLVTAAITAHTEDELRAGRVLLDASTERRLGEQALDDVLGLGALEPLLADPEIETINIDRFDRVFVHYADGHRAQVGPVAATDAELTELVRTLAARVGAEERRFDRASPALNLQLPGGQRLFAVRALTPGGDTAVSIRRHRYRHASLGELRARGTVDAGLARFLTALVTARKNILITGGTGYGKTTLLRALAAELDPLERIITIEDTLELGLDTDTSAHADVVALQAREPNIEGEGAISQAELLRWALRMSPDRVIVGEIRGPEVIPMCQAMSQGDDGSMATLHASSSRVAFTRLAAYAAQSPERLSLEATALMVASAVHFVVHLDKATDGRTRVVSSVREVVDADAGTVISNEVYRPGPDGRAVPVAGALRADSLDDLLRAGLDPTVLTPTTAAPPVAPPPTPPAGARRARSGRGGEGSW